MTKKELEQIFDICKEIKMWQRELDRLKYQSAIKSPNLSGMPRSTDKDFGRDQEIKADTEKVIKGLCAKAELHRVKVLDYIENIEDSLERQIIYFKCACNMRFWEIGREVRMSESGVKSIYYRHFKNKKVETN